MSGVRKLVERVRRVASFWDGTLQGNPAGVVVLSGDDPWPDEAAMQSAAAAVGYSETAFVRKNIEQGHWDIRYFTPTVEVDLCGHATLAAAFVLDGSLATGAMHFRAAGGELRVEPVDDSGFLWMDFPAEPLPVEALDGRAGVESALGGTAVESLFRGRSDLLVRLPAATDVFRCSPSVLEISALDTRGIIITAPATPGSGFDFVSRFFAPACGIMEDPVTGSAHCLLGPYWGRELGKQEMAAYQASDRGGLVRVELRDAGRIGIGGRATAIRQ